MSNLFLSQGGRDKSPPALTNGANNETQ